jgi:pilus assembly protein TadC
LDFFSNPLSVVELTIAVLGVAGAAVATIMAWTGRVNRSEGNIESIRASLQAHVDRGYALEAEMRVIAKDIHASLEELKERTKLLEYRINKLEDEKD